MRVFGFRSGFTLLSVLSLAAVGLASPSWAYGLDADVAEKPGFSLPRGTAVDALPLRSQTTTVEVTGVIAHIHLEQVWENAGRVPLEATYVFPTSTRSALHDLRLKVNDQRELRAEIRQKEQAQKIFDAARDAGQTAGLLEQQRPNAVTMNLTNIMPGDRIVVVVEASELVRPTDGIYELVLPQTLGPRFDGNPGSEVFVDNGFTGTTAVKTRIDLTIRSPIGVRRVGSPSHGVTPKFRSSDEVDVAFVSTGDDVVADRDLVLRWQLAGNQTETGVLMFRAPKGEAGENFFVVLGEAPPEVKAEEAPPREVIFVVDVSGSMAGFPLEIGKRLVRDLVDELRPQDRFNMLFFAGSGSMMSQDGSIVASPKNRANALALLDGHRGGGGTQLMDALTTALAFPRSEGADDDGVRRARMIVVVTDGFISAERAVFDTVRQNLGAATLFAFGIGQSVNRQLIEGLAAAGRTEPFVMLGFDQGERAVDHFRTVAGRPALTNIDVRFEGFAVSDLEPARAPDLYPGRPLVMLGKYTGPSAGRVVVSGDGLAGKRYENVIAIEDNLERAEHAALAQLWARERIARLADRATPTDADLEEVTALGLRHRLLTERTSFVVVDPAVRNVGEHGQPGELAVVAQPLVAPAGVATGVGIGSVGTQGKTGNVFGPGGLGAGVNGVLGGLRGSSIGGGALGSFGTGGLGTRGSGSGGGGIGSVDLGGRGKGTTSIKPGNIIYMGGLSREEIQRPLMRVMSQIKYCYERELMRTPELQGKLVLRWTIAGQGLVTALLVESDSLQSPAVAACVQRVVGRLVFPAPPGGGVVSVTYPFIFTTK